MALTDGTSTNTVEFVVYIAATVGERSRSTPEVAFTLVSPVMCAVIRWFGTVTLLVVPFIVMVAEVTLKRIMFIVEFAGTIAVPITTVVFTSPNRFTVPLPAPLTQLLPEAPAVCTPTEE
jgi:hypothetical protein